MRIVLVYSVQNRLEVDCERVTKLQKFKVQSLHALQYMFSEELCVGVYEELGLQPSSELSTTNGG